MRTIRKMNLPMLNNIAMAGYGQECAAATELLSAVTELDSTVQNFNNKLAEYEDKLKLKGTEAYTNKIHVIVDTVEEAWTGLYLLVDGLTRYPDEATSEKAESVKGKMDFYGSLMNLSYDVKFGKVVSLLGDITSDEANVLGITAFLETLSKGNSEFVSVSAQRKDYRKVRKTAVKAARTALELAYRALVNNVESLVVANGIGAYEAFVNRINELVIERGVKMSNTKDAGKESAQNSETAAEAVAVEAADGQQSQDVSANDSTEDVQSA